MMIMIVIGAAGRRGQGPGERLFGGNQLSDTTCLMQVVYIYIYIYTHTHMYVYTYVSSNMSNTAAKCGDP